MPSENVVRIILVTLSKHIKAAMAMTPNITPIIFFAFLLNSLLGTSADERSMNASPKISTSNSMMTISLLLFTYGTQHEPETADVVVFLEDYVLIFRIYGAEAVAAEFFDVAFAVV